MCCINGCKVEEEDIGQEREGEEALLTGKKPHRHISCLLTSLSPLRSSTCPCSPSGLEECVLALV